MPQVDPVAAGIIAGLLTDPRLRPLGGTPARNALRLLRYWRTLLPLPVRVVRFIAMPDSQRLMADAVILSRMTALRDEAIRPLPLGRQTGVVREIARRGLRNLFLAKFFPMVASGVISITLAQGMVYRFGLDRRMLQKARQGLAHNKTTTMDLDLWALAERVAGDADASHVIVNEPPFRLSELYWKAALPEMLQEGMATFLFRYGHRGIREIDIGMPRWAEDPTYLFGVLHTYVGSVGTSSVPDQHFRKQAEAADRAVADIIAQARRLRLGWLKARLLSFLLRRYRRIGGLRESPKFYMVWLFQAIRQMALEAGAQMVGMGLLDRADDVSFLRFEEIAPVSDAGRLKLLVFERRQAYQRELERRRVPRVLSSEGEAFYGVASEDGGFLSGMGVSPGVASGIARVIRSPIGAQLEPAEILVAPSTDPAWTPLFLTAGGLVMEAGGMMSHGAVVAREYGIPAVAGVAGALDRIDTGQRVEVDGDQGRVTLV